MTLLDRLEKKFSWLAVPYLLTIIAGLQILVYVITKLRGEDAGNEFLLFLVMDEGKVLSGQVWRMLTYTLIPSNFEPIFLIFGALVLHTIGQTLEQTIGAFRVTLFFLATALLIAVGLLIAHLLNYRLSSWETMRMMFNPAAAVKAPYILYALISMLLGLKCPNLVWRLFFVIPVSSAILGWLAFGGLVWAFFSNGSLRVPIVLGFIPFALMAAPVFYTWYYLKERVWKNRPAFESAKHQFDDHFSKCQNCGRTDRSHPELVFRVAGDGEEYCHEHLPSA